MSKVLALDYGMKRCGIAVSDDERHWAFPRGWIDASQDEQLIADLEKLINEEDITEIVVGRPLSQAGNPTEVTTAVERFVAALRERVALPITLLDERMTTAQANRWMHVSERSREQKSQDRDALSAVAILQMYLDQPTHG